MPGAPWRFSGLVIYYPYTTEDLSRSLYNAVRHLLSDLWPPPEMNFDSIRTCKNLQIFFSRLFPLLLAARRNSNKGEKKVVLSLISSSLHLIQTILAIFATFCFPGFWSSRLQKNAFYGSERKYGSNETLPFAALTSIKIYYLNRARMLSGHTRFICRKGWVEKRN